MLHCVFNGSLKHFKVFFRSSWGDPRVFAKSAKCGVRAAPSPCSAEGAHAAVSEKKRYFQRAAYVNTSRIQNLQKGRSAKFESCGIDKSYDLSVQCYAKYIAFTKSKICRTQSLQSLQGLR